jgi:hypothetical protein
MLTIGEHGRPGRWPGEARFSHRGSRSRLWPKARPAVMSVKSITEQIQHTLNIAKVTAQARVNQPCVG